MSKIQISDLKPPVFLENVSKQEQSTIYGGGGVGVGGTGSGREITSVQTIGKHRSSIIDIFITCYDQAG
jgi:hypothetical protein